MCQDHACIFAAAGSCLWSRVCPRQSRSQTETTFAGANQGRSGQVCHRIKPKYLPNSTGLAVPEKALISHGLKWWPIKQYEATLNEDEETSDWRLEVSSLVRAESTFPAEGVPFSLLMTIEDPNVGSQYSANSSNNCAQAVPTSKHCDRYSASGHRAIDRGQSATTAEILTAAWRM